MRSHMNSRRSRGPKPNRRRALELLAGSRDGMTEAMLLAYGFMSRPNPRWARDRENRAHGRRWSAKVARLRTTTPADGRSWRAK
jgi:hypothetical protein